MSKTLKADEKAFKETVGKPTDRNLEAEVGLLELGWELPGGFGVSVSCYEDGAPRFIITWGYSDPDGYSSTELDDRVQAIGFVQGLLQAHK